MPRRSAASLAVRQITPSPSRRIPPRDGMPAEVAAEFNEIVAIMPEDHFRPQDAGLVELYGQAIVLSRQAYEALAAEGPVVDGKVSAWLLVLKQSHQSAAALATKLRLPPLSRTDPKTVGRANAPPESAYERMAREGWR
jgi:hypothetical protein